MSAWRNIFLVLILLQYAQNACAGPWNAHVGSSEPGGGGKKKTENVGTSGKVPLTLPPLINVWHPTHHSSLLRYIPCIYKYLVLYPLSLSLSSTPSLRRFVLGFKSILILPSFLPPSIIIIIFRDGRIHHHPTPIHNSLIGCIPSRTGVCCTCRWSVRFDAILNVTCAKKLHVIAPSADAAHKCDMKLQPALNWELKWRR